MATEKVTTMVLKVDLQCPSCYKKCKKTLCKFPQIRDQIYDEKSNTVTITVLCCSPEKIRDKLCCKGGKAIKSIAIKDSAKPKDSEKPKQAEKPKDSEKPKQPAEKPKIVAFEPKDAGKPKDADKPKDAGKPKPNEKGDKPKSNGGPPAEKPKSSGGPPGEKPAEKPKDAPKPEPAKNPGPVMTPVMMEPAKGPDPAPVQGVPSVFPYVGPSYDGCATGPYYHGYGFPAPPPQPCYEGYYGYGYGYGRATHVNRGDSYFSEEDQACSIM